MGYEFETTFIKCFKKLIKTSRNAQKASTVFMEMKKELQLLVRDENERVALEYFDYITWVEAKLQNQSYGELKKLKHIGMAP